MSHQRRRGQLAKVWRTVETTDQRGNVTRTATPENAHEVRAVFTPLPAHKGRRAVRMLVAAELDDVDAWSRVEYMGHQWDLLSLPALHLGTRNTRHWSFDLIQRP